MIVVTEIESVHGSAQRMIFYRCQDQNGNWYPYGPVITTDANFDANAFKATVALKVAESLAVQEFEGLIRG
jgi:hypothetical protein